MLLTGTGSLRCVCYSCARFEAVKAGFLRGFRHFVPDFPAGLAVLRILLPVYLCSYSGSGFCSKVSGMSDQAN